MTWLVLVILVAGFLWWYSKSQDATPIAVENPVPGNELDGIDFLWRPG